MTSPPPPAGPLTTPPILPNAPLNHNDNKKHLLLCATGSVATIKIPQIARALSAHPSLSIRLILTNSAAHFLRGQSAEQPSLTTLLSLPNIDAIYLDRDEWAEPWTRGAPILHIELRRWAHLMVIAPLSANSLAKMAGGWCDNLLLSTVRAWDAEAGLDGGGAEGSVGMRKRIVVAPAMNTAMWTHPVTKRHIALLGEEWGMGNGGWIEVLSPVEKRIACGDTGIGGMVEWPEIVKVIEDRLALGRDVSWSK